MPSARYEEGWRLMIYNVEPMGRAVARLSLHFDATALVTIQPRNPCATTYTSADSARLAGGFACLTLVKSRFIRSNT